jgi:hypothetical protein
VCEDLWKITSKFRHTRIFSAGGTNDPISLLEKFHKFFLKFALENLRSMFRVWSHEKALFVDHAHHLAACGSGGEGNVVRCQGAARG